MDKDIFIMSVKQKLEKETGISRQLISKYLTGEAIPGSDNLLTLANYFGVSCDYLLGKERATTHEISDICEKTGLTQKSVEKLIYYMNDDSKNKYNVIFAINQILEYNCSDFLLAFARYTAHPKIDECDFDDKYYFNLYVKYDLLKSDSTKYELLKESEFFDLISKDEIIYYQLMQNFTALVKSIKEDELTKEKYIKEIKENLKQEYEEAVETYDNPADMIIGEISFGGKK